MIIKNPRKESGQSLVEFAVVLPLLLLLVFGIIEFGRIFQASLVVNHAARESARQAIVAEDAREATIKQVVEIAGSSLGLIFEDNVTTYPSGDKALNNLLRGQTLIVQVDYDVKLVTPIISSIISDDGKYSVQGKVYMMVE